MKIIKTTDSIMTQCGKIKTKREIKPPVKGDWNTSCCKLMELVAEMSKETHIFPFWTPNLSREFLVARVLSFLIGALLANVVVLEVDVVFPPAGHTEEICTFHRFVHQPSNTVTLFNLFYLRHFFTSEFLNGAYFSVCAATLTVLFISWNCYRLNCQRKCGNCVKMSWLIIMSF